MLARHGASRQRQTTKRFEWSQRGALLHIDAYSAPKSQRAGHWATGDRTKRSRDAGKTVVVGAVDDHTRLA